MTEHSHKWIWLDPVVISRDEREKQQPSYQPSVVFAFGVPRRCDCGMVEIVKASVVLNSEQQTRADEAERKRQAGLEKSREYNRKRKEKPSDD